MPKLSKALPTYRKHKPTGRAVVTLNGRDYYLGLYGSKVSKLEYDRLIGEWLQRGRRPAAAEPADESLTVVVLCARYLRFALEYYCKDGQPTRTVAGIKCAIKYLRDWYGRTSAAEFGPLALKTVQHRMINDGLSRRYVNDHTGRIKRIFKWGVAEELLPAATHQALAVVPGLRKGRTAARETDPIEPVEDATVDATLPHLPNVVTDMVRLERLTGMRPAEVCILRPCDLDRSGKVWSYTPRSHKTEHRGRSRIVFIGPKAQAVLFRYLARDAQAYCFCPRDSEAKRRASLHDARTTPLNCGNRPGSNKSGRTKRRTGERYTTDSYRRAIGRACDKAFPHPTFAAIAAAGRTPEQVAALKQWQKAHRWAPNRLRHTAGTEIRRQFGLEAAQVVLGHARADVTQVYAKRDAATACQVALIIG